MLFYHSSICNINNFYVYSLLLKIYSLCMTLLIFTNIAEGQSSENSLPVEMMTNTKIQEYIFPFKMKSFLESLYQLDIQESHKRKKKSMFIKRNSDRKRKVPSEMKNQIENLMSNITKSLNDVDWKLGLEHDSQKNNPKVITNCKRKPKLIVKRMKEEDDENSDMFLDSFVRQMFLMDPSILEKIFNRIGREYSNLKRHVKPKEQNMKNIKRKVDNNPVKSDYNFDLYSDTNLLTKQPETEKLSYQEDKIMKNEDYSLLNDDYFDTSTTTLSTTTQAEGFYDYGDYYRDDEINKLNDMAHYEIVQDVLQSSTDLNDYLSGFGSRLIKSQYKKPRNIDNNFKTFKKRLKKQNYKSRGFNTNYSY